jgi:hypothetical protein
MKEIVCTSCGYIGKPRRVRKGRKGSGWEWLIFPLNLVFVMWRMLERKSVCYVCGADGSDIHDTSRPVGRRLKAHYAEQPLNKEPEPPAEVPMATQPKPRQNSPEDW